MRAYTFLALSCIQDGETDVSRHVSRSVNRLSARFDPAGEPLSFDKDDEDTLDFVVGAANLRAAAFDIESQTKFQVKGACRC